MKASKGRDRANVPQWFKVSAAFLEDHPLPIVALVADRIQRREKARQAELLAEKRTLRGRPLREYSSLVQSQGSASKPGIAARASLSSTGVPFVSRRVSPSERIESSDRKMITSVTEQGHMKKGKKNPAPEFENIPPVDEAEFTDVIRKMVNTSPVTREEVERRGIQRRKNPETDPRYLPVFDFSRKINMTPEVAKTVRLTDEHSREYRKKKKS